jgi:nicotinamide mononucleotide transporter
LGRKYLENWLIWMLVNGVSIGLFAYKSLWLTVLLYTIFLGMSWMGWRTWHGKMKASV